MSIRERAVPVFIYPNELTFYVGNHTTHKQLLTLYNPYDFPVKYQVFANTTDKYSVVEPKGNIKAHAYIDLLVRHNAPFQINCHSKDKFMITMQDATTNQVLGKRCFLATLLPGERDTTSIGDESVHSYSAFEMNLPRERTRINETEPWVKKFSIGLSLFFIIILLFPTKCDDPGDSAIPSYLHVPVPVKIFIGYVLGIITITLVRQF